MKFIVLLFDSDLFFKIENNLQGIKMKKLILSLSMAFFSYSVLHQTLAVPIQTM